MISSFGGFPRILTLENDLNDICSNIMDEVVDPLFYPFMTLAPFQSRRSSHKAGLDEKKYVITISIGKQYELNDITTHIDGRKLIVKGLTTDKIKNGTNTHSFERTYDLPENVLLETMKSSLSNNGNLHIVFDRKVVQPKPDEEDLSTPEEYRMKISTRGFKPDTLKAQVVDGVLVIEGTHQSQSNVEGTGTETTVSGYYLRKIKLPNDVNPDTVRVSVSGDDSLVAFAPRDPSRKRTGGRMLEIERK